MSENIQNGSEEGFLCAIVKNFELIYKTWYIFIVCYVAMSHAGQLELKKLS